MTTCTIETGLFRKKPCGHVSVAKCENCEQPLCAHHAIAQLSESGSRTGKFLCQECAAAQKDQSKAMAGAARAQEERKQAAIAKDLMEKASAPAAAKPSPRPVAAQPAPAAQVKAPETLEFTPSDGKLEYTPKKDT